MSQKCPSIPKIRHKNWLNCYNGRTFQNLVKNWARHLSKCRFFPIGNGLVYSMPTIGVHRQERKQRDLNDAGPNYGIGRPDCQPAQAQKLEVGDTGIDLKGLFHLLIHLHGLPHTLRSDDADVVRLPLLFTGDRGRPVRLASFPASSV